MVNHAHTRPAALRAFLSLGLLFACATSAATAPGAPLPNTPTPNGLVVVIEDKPLQPRLNLEPLHNPFISGVALQIRWRDLEPVQGHPDWSKLDQLFSAAESQHKWVQLLIFPGFWSPEWALAGAQTLMLPIQYGPGKGTLQKLPVPWDHVYLSRWFDFLKLLSARYANSPAFQVAAAAGPTSVSAEFTLPHNGDELQMWRNAGYTPSKYLEAWRTVFQMYASDFPNQYVSLSTGSGINIDDRGKKDARAGKPTKEALIDEAISVLGPRFVLQNSNLDGNPEPARGPNNVALVKSYSGRLITGLQLRTSCLRNSGNMGAEGDPPLALKKSIHRGMLLNATGHHINYLEIYEPDVLADVMQPVLRDAASQFK